MGRAGAARAVLGGVLAAAALLPAAAGGAALEPADVPGLDRAGSGKKVARAALGTRPPKSLRKVPTEGVAYKGENSRLETGVFTLASEKAAKKSLKAVRRGARRIELGDGAVERHKSSRRVETTSIAVRVGEAIGAVSFAVRSQESSTPGARAYAEALAPRLERLVHLTAWQRTLDDIAPDGSITPELALRAFSIAYGPIPGVERPEGRMGPPESGTLAMQLVARVWDQLSPEQQAAINLALGAPHDSRSSAPPRNREQVLTPDAGYQALADKYVSFYRSVIPGTPAITARVFKASETIPGVYMDALPVNADGQWGVGAPAYCRIRVPPNAQAEEGQPFFELVMAHEVFHCVEFSLMANWRQRSAWVIEGLADWAAVTAFPVSADVGAGPYRYYLETPTTPLFARSYDASGFWGRIDEYIGKGSLWTNIPAIVGAATDAASFDASGASFSGFLQSWASAMWRFPTAAWNQTDPFSIPFAEKQLPHAPITESTDIASDPYVTRHYRIVPKESRPMVSLESLAPHLRVGSFTTDYGPVTGLTGGTEGKEYYCFGKCKCPPGKAGSLPPNIKVDGASLFLALTGGATAATARVGYHDPKDLCEDKDDPDPAGPSGPAGTNGDPHMTSMDGLHYDFQGAGEFTLLRSNSGDLDIQARQEPWLKSNRATINTQIAMGIEGHRVTVGAGSNAFDGPVVRLDGAVDPLAPGETRSLGNGSVTRTRGDGWIAVTWPDGSKAVVRGVGSYGVAATVQLAAGRTGSVAGLLGNFDRNPANDLETRSGKGIPYNAKRHSGWPPFERFRVEEEFKPKFFDDLYDTVGDSWRIEQRDSLFDYGPGQSTKTFTDRSIPERPLDPAKISDKQRAKAARICNEMGVTEPGPLADCIVDLFVTGRLEFAEDALIEQEISDASFARLAAGAARVGDLSALEANDGSLHIGFNDRAAGGMVDVRLDPARGELPPETIAAADSEPFLFAGPDGGVHAEAAELRSSGASGIYQYSRSADGTWQSLGAVATGGLTYASRPFALFAGDTLFTASPMAGVGRIFRGAPAGPGVEPTASRPDCYGSSPTLARDDQSGELWVAWMQWDCPDVGLFVQQIDRATGNLVGSPIMAPGSSNGSTGGAPFFLPADEPLGFTGRPGQAGVFLVYPGADRRQLSLWRVGEGGVTTIPSRGGEVGQAELEADPANGRLWLAWEEGERLWLGESDGGSLLASPRAVEPPPDAETPLFTGDHWNISASPGALDVLYGYQRTSDTPGAIWHAQVPAG